MLIILISLYFLDIFQQAEFIKPYFDLELTSKGIGVSLVDDELKKEVAYIGITRLVCAYYLFQSQETHKFFYFFVQLGSSLGG